MSGREDWHEKQRDLAAQTIMEGLLHEEWHNDGHGLSLAAEGLDALLDLLQQGDRLTLEHGGYVSLTTFGVLRAVGHEAALEALGKEEPDDVIRG